MRQFFLERVQEESVLSGQAFMYLHYADMIANGYKRTMPCPFRTQGLLLNPDGDAVLLRELAAARQRARRRRRGHLLQGRATSPHRDAFKKTICPTCLSPCQVNVGAMKQFVPYAKFLVRAYRVKRDPDAAPRDASQRRSEHAARQPMGADIAVALVLLLSAVDQSTQPQIWHVASSARAVPLAIASG